MQYGLYESEEALMQALEQQAQRYEDAL